LDIQPNNVNIFLPSFKKRRNSHLSIATGKISLNMFVPYAKIEVIAFLLFSITHKE
jgi:hypothetical protein